ncbi:MAG: hypothetical protein IMZ52_09985 [Actinobacteria bacterium]|nr:hypothetical protein [Actinomycetota bacterium]MBE3122108.1 hypothetical protein [Thermoplasmata archaeon]
MAVRPLVGFGVGLIGGGLFWALIQDTLTRMFGGFIRDTSDKYYLASNLIWTALPYAIIILGIVCLIFSGFNKSSGVDE